MIVLITGMMAAGKSSVAQRLCERLPHSVHLRGDVFRKMIVNGRADMAADGSDAAFEQLLLRYRIAQAAAEHYSNAGFTVIYQDTIIGPVLADVLSLYAGEMPQVFVLNPSLECIKQRESARSKTGYNHYTPEQLFEIFLTTPKVGRWIDSSDLTIDQTVDDIITELDLP